MTRNKIKVFTFIILLIITACCLISYRNKPTLAISPYPGGKNFAFTITDDPDGAKLEKIKHIYTYLDKLGFKTTMACWVYKPTELVGLPTPEEQYRSETLENREYLEFLKEYQKRGFEIALHTVTAGHDKREITIQGYARFKKMFGEYPKINIMHSKNRENIYWGENAFRNYFMKILARLYTPIKFSGENPSSKYFWGDICKEKTRYVRLWGTSDINTLKYNPSMPYYDETKPYVNYWFSFSDGYKAKYFNKLLSKRNVDKLVRERGACIVYTHFAAGFCKKKSDRSYFLDENVKKKLLYLSKQKEGWFVPAGDLLDRLLAVKDININIEGKAIKIKNNNKQKIKGITLMSGPGMEFIDASGKVLVTNKEGELVLGNFAPQEVKTITAKAGLRALIPPKSPNFIEGIQLVWERLKIMIFSHRG